MAKTTINVSEQLLSSFLGGFILSVLIVIVAHFLPVKWSYITDNYTGYMNSTVGQCGYKCSLGSYHFGNCKGMTVGDVGGQTRDFGNIISASFDGHGGLIIIIGLIATALIYLLKKVNFNVVKD